MNETLILIFLLLIKHFIVDYQLQKRYRLNKGVYGHIDGLIHANEHGLGTYCCFVWVDPLIALYLAVVDMVIHYHIDWAKSKFKSTYITMTPNQLRLLTVVDQLGHLMTYALLIKLMMI